jgi:Helix-turn-helix domain
VTAGLRAPESREAPLGTGLAHPSRERGSQGRTEAIVAKLCELGLSTYRGSGLAVPPDVARALGEVALGSPATAARCPRLLAALPADVRAAVLRQASGPPVSEIGNGVADLPHWLTVREAAELAGITAHGIRDRCRRGRLTATKHRVTGEWRIDGTDLG